MALHYTALALSLLSAASSAEQTNPDPQGRRSSCCMLLKRERIKHILPATNMLWCFMSSRFGHAHVTPCNDSKRLAYNLTMSVPCQYMIDYIF